MTVPADDRGLLLGDGLFETVLFRAGEPVLWDAHLARLQRGCAVLGLSPPDPALLASEAALALAAAGLQDARAAVRLTWTAGSGGRGLMRPQAPVPRLTVTAAPSPRLLGDAVVITASVRRNAASPSSRLKSLSYLDNVLARREAAAVGADEALMLNTDGRIAGASAANLFWIADGRLSTPSLAAGVLDGIMRGAVIAAARRLGAPVEEVLTGPPVAEALFLTSSLIGIRRIARLDGGHVGSHPLLATLQRAVEPFC